MSSSQQIATLSTQVEALGAINETLQRYLEAVVTKVSPDDAPELIESERKRLEEIEQLDQLKNNDFFQGAFNTGQVKVEHFKETLLKAKTFEDFSKKIGAIAGDPELTKNILEFRNNAIVIADVNEGRAVVGKEPFPLPDDTRKRGAQRRRAR